MKSSVLHAIKKFLRISVVLMVLVGMNKDMYAQGNIPGLCSASCNNQVNVSLDNSGHALIDPVMVWEEGLNIACFPLLESITVEIVNAVPVAGSETLYGATVITGSALLDCAFIDQTVEYKLVKKYLDGTVNTCWGDVLIEDKISPSIACNDLFIECNQPTDPYQLVNFFLAAVPATSDNCDNNVALDYSDVEDNYGCTGDYLQKITRTWTATDDSGNESSCTQSIYIKKADLGLIAYPGNLDDISNPALDCANPNTDPSATGYPTYDGLPIVNGGPCKFSVDYEDHVLGACGGSSKIIREWTILNWCTSEVFTHNQIIKLLDKTAPVIVCPSIPEIGTTSNSCAGNVQLPAALITDDCSTFTVTTTTPNGVIIGNGGLVTNLPLGDHVITYTATDDCDNVSSCSTVITVIDNVPPTAICDEHTIASLGSDGYVSIPASVFDDGSYDNCELVDVKVRRMTDACHVPPQLEFGDYAEFCCADLGSTIMVELRVTDAAGNTNSCMVEVEVQDKLKPTIICPSNKTINCDDDAFDFGLTGEATGFDNCGDVTISHIDLSNTITECGEGYILRQFIATDGQGLTSSCIQTITVTNPDPFTIVDTECRTYLPINHIEPPVGPHSSKDDVEWPCDITLNTCGNGLQPSDLEVNYPLDARPQVEEGYCDLIAVTHDDLELPIQGDACLKILRTWIIIDWCNYDEQNPNAGGRWEYVQVIKVLNSTAPQVFPGGDSFVENFDADCGNAYVELFVNATDDCTPTEDLEYSYVIETAAGAFVSQGTNTNASGAFANGEYVITWTVADGCSNYESASYPFKVEDRKKPTPVCINGLSTDLMPNAGMVTIWASDFEAGSSFDNCTPYSALKFSFSSDVTETSKTFTCDDIGTQVVELWVTDNAGNQDFCQTYILIQDNNGACGGPTTFSAIEGNVENEMGEQIEDVTISVNGSNAVPTITGANGSYAFPTIPNSNSYDVAAEKNMNPKNGVTTFDLVLISKHILGITALDSPYKVIAADINRSNSITTFDIVQARRLILDIDTEFSNNTSWRFVDAGFVFPNPANPFASDFPEVVSISDLSADEAANFIGVKIGDVNASATPNNLLGSETRTTDGTLALNADDVKVNTGEEVVIDFKAKDFNAINGFQFTFNFDNTVLEFVDVKSGIESISAQNFGFTNVSEGLISASWNTAKAVSLDDDAVIFSLVFNATAAAQLSETVSISSRVATAEAYNDASDVLDVQLAFNGTVAANDFRVMQNQPNPFKDATVIPFNMAEAGTVTLKVMDVTGKIVSVKEGDFNKGYNEFKLTRNDVPSAGVMYYSVETGTNTVTKKMIIINK